MRLFVAAFLAGVGLLQSQPELPAFSWGGVGVALLLTAWLVRRGWRVLHLALMLAGAAACGYGYAGWRAEVRLAEELPSAWEGADIELTGVVAGLPQITPRGARFLFEVEHVGTEGAVVPRTLSLTWYRERREDAPVPTVRAAERWSFTVRLRRPHGLSNPHAFDFEVWALERGIRATGYVRPKSQATRLDDRVEGWPYTLHRWRDEVRARMFEHLGDARLRGVLVALAIGDQDSIAAPDWEVFWRTGVGHLMSISGLHITMFAALAFFVAFRLWARVPALALRLPARKAAVVAGMVAALAYTLMTGYAVPAQRTFVMLAVVACCVLLDRQGAPSRVLAVAALGVVLLDPWAVLSAGFWLSFGAVASIFYVMALRTGRHGKLHGAVLEQLAVTVVMLPMLMALFQEISLVSPLANSFAIPLVSLVVVPLTIAGAFLPLPWLLDVAHLLMQWLMVPLEWLASWPNAMLESHAPAAWTVALAVAGCLWLLAPRGVPMRCLGAIWVAPMFLVRPPGPAPGEAWIEALDVGNGLAIVVRTATHAMAYDAGPAWSEDADTGNRIVVPYLRGEGIPRLDGLLISHADDDHSGGAESIARLREPPWLLTSIDRANPLHESFARSIRCEAGFRWTWDGVQFRVVHPAAEAYMPPAPDSRGRVRARKENDRSCVLRVETAGAAALLTGDAEARSEMEMLARDATAVRAQVLVVPHHGSRTSSTAAFLDAVHPGVALISVGYRNRFHHPAPAVVARYQERGIAIRRTDEEGALRITLSAAPPGFRVEPLAAHASYWSPRKLRPPPAQ